MSQVKGVQRVHPMASGRILVYLSDKDAITKKSVEKLLEGHAKFRLRKMKRA